MSSDVRFDDRLQLYDFELPESLIAKYPAEKRDGARLLVFDRKKDTFTHSFVKHLPDFLSSQDLLLMNNSKVMHARLFLNKETGGQVEILITEIFGEGRVRAMSKSSKPLRVGMSLLHTQSDRLFEVEKIEPDGFVQLEFQGSKDKPEEQSLESFLERYGELPLPPYLGRKPDSEDEHRYQTIYANMLGSVAAPTAGLHFTEELFASLDEKGIRRSLLTLHVGPGTFLPVREAPDGQDSIASHTMHYEWTNVSEELVREHNATRAVGGRVVAVGTTVVRTLESRVPLRSGAESTNIFIRPGHEFKNVDAMFTNFHLPKSTLFILVSAFAGRERMLWAYKEAIASGYRFYSYGDAMLIL